MHVRVLFFGVLREQMGAAELSVEVRAEATVGELLRVLQAGTSKKVYSGSDMEALWRGLAVAVNREYAAVNQPLAEGDEVALLPPVSGGVGRP